jgi:hypothetical protein
MTPIFFLCVGCQKGGTTWLAEHLRPMPEVRLGARKEMHALDVLYLDAFRDWHLTRMRRLERDIARVEAAGRRPELVGSMTRKLGRYREAQAIAESLDAYLAYFRGRADESPEVRVVADLTPDYALLGASDWTATRAAIVAAGFAPRVLFLMRDPVARLESVWRMQARDAAAKAERVSGLLRRAAARGTAMARHAAASLLPAPSEAGFLDFASEPLNLGRSQYQATIQALEAAFPAEEIQYEFYETLFAQSAVDRIMAFIGLPPRPADFALRVNASPLRRPIAPQELARVRARLEPTYRFCAERFGEARIAAIWKNFAPRAKAS